MLRRSISALPGGGLQDVVSNVSTDITLLVSYRLGGPDVNAENLRWDNRTALSPSQCPTGLLLTTEL
jgi:hypothetical protein